jgi:hypothetical protein
VADFSADQLDTIIAAFNKLGYVDGRVGALLAAERCEARPAGGKGEGGALRGLQMPPGEEPAQPRS